MSFQQLPASASIPGQRKWVNRRGTVRYQCAPATIGKVYSPAPEDFVRVCILDLSRGGAGILANRSLVPGLDIIGQLIHEPELRAIFADAVVGPRLKLVESILRSAVEDGDLDPATLTPFTAKIGPALINQQALLTGVPPNRRELALIVDTVIPPRGPAGSD